MTTATTGAITAQIRCIRKQDRDDPHERILKIGGVNRNGARWTLTQQEAISGIQSGKYKFYVSVGDDSVWVVVSTSRYGNKYLKTENDGEDQNNLLSLRECP